MNTLFKKFLVAAVLVTTAVFAVSAVSAQVGLPAAIAGWFALNLFVASATGQFSYRLGATLTNLNDTIFAQNALEAFVRELAPLSAFSTSYSAEAERKGSAVIVPLVSALTATTFNSDYEVGGGTMTGVTVNLDKHFIVSVDLTDVQAANSSSADLEKFGRQGGAALATAIITDIFGLVTSANFGTAVITTAAANFNYTQANLLRKRVTALNMPRENRSLFLDGDSCEALLNDSSIKASFATSLAESMVNGAIPRVAGFSLRELQIIPTVDGQYAFAVHPSAIAVAVRYLQPQAPGEYLEVRRLDDPNTGLTIGYRRHYSTKTGRHYLNLEAIWGRAVGISSGIRRVATTA